jgi:RimJ/RimL family protein N-acetyltransferase
MNLELHTERLSLRPFADTDLDLALEMWADPEVVKYVGDVMTEKEIRLDMPNATKRGGNGGIGIWSVADRATGEKLGDSYLLPMAIDEDDTDFDLVVMGQMPDADIEVGFFFKPSAWGRGYATEVCKRLLQFAFQELPINEIVASVDDRNIASQKALKKSGLINRGRTRSYGKDSPIYRITRDEWNELQ